MSDGAFKGLFVAFAIVVAAVFFLSSNGLRSDTEQNSAKIASAPTPKPVLAPARTTLESSADVLNFLVGSHCAVHTRQAGGMDWPAIYRMDVSTGGRYSHLRMRLGVYGNGVWEEQELGTLTVSDGRWKNTGTRFFSARDETSPWVPTLTVDRESRSISMFNGVEALGRAENCSRFK